MEFKMIKKLLAVVFAASTIGSTVSSVGATFNEDELKKVKKDISEYENSIKQLENTVKMEKISNQDILKQFNDRIDANKKTLDYIKNLIDKNKYQKKDGDKLAAYISNAEKSNEQLKNKDENLSNNVNKALEETRTKREALLKKLIALFSEQTDNKQTNDNEKNNVNENDNKVIKTKKKFEEIYDELDRENTKFINWMGTNKNIYDDITEGIRTEAIKLGNSLKKNFDAKKSKNFIKLAKEAINIMKEFIANIEFNHDDLIKIQKSYRDKCNDFYQKQLKFNTWSKENNIDSQQREAIIQKIKECDILRKQIDSNLDLKKIGDFLKLSQETTDMMENFKKQCEQQNVEREERITKKYQEVYQTFKVKVDEFRDWRAKNFPNINKDNTRFKRNKTIDIFNDLKSDCKNVEKMRKFIDLAKESIKEMQGFMIEKSGNKVNNNTNKAELERLKKKLKETFLEKYQGFLKSKIEFKIWAEKNNVNYQCTDAWKKRKILFEFYNKNKNSDQINTDDVQHLEKLVTETTNMMDNFKEKYKQQEVEREKNLETMWNEIVAGNQNVGNVVKVKVKDAETGEYKDNRVPVSETCGIFHATNGLNFYKYLEGESDYIQGFENVKNHYLAHGGKEEYIPQLKGKRRGRALDAQEVKEYLNNNGINTYSLQNYNSYATEFWKKKQEIEKEKSEKLNTLNEEYKQKEFEKKKQEIEKEKSEKLNTLNEEYKQSIDEEREKIKQEQQEFVKDILRTHFRFDDKSPVFTPGQGHWRTLAGYRNTDNGEQILLVESVGKKLVKWVALDSIVEQIIADKEDRYSGINIAWDLILCSKSKTSDTYALINCQKDEKERVLNNVAEFSKK